MEPAADNFRVLLGADDFHFNEDVFMNTMYIGRYDKLNVIDYEVRIVYTTTWDLSRYGKVLWSDETMFTWGCWIVSG